MQRLTSDDDACAALGAALRAFRTGAALTQERLAQRAGVTKNYVADVEAGARNPTFLVLNRLLKALGLGWDELGQALDAAAPDRLPPPGP